MFDWGPGEKTFVFRGEHGAMWSTTDEMVHELLEVLILDIVEYPVEIGHAPSPASLDAMSTAAGRCSLIY